MKGAKYMRFAVNFSRVQYEMGEVHEVCCELQ